MQYSTCNTSLPYIQHTHGEVHEMKHPPDHEETERHALRTVLQQRGHVLVSLGEDRRIVEDHREQVHLAEHQDQDVVIKLTTD